MGTIATNFRIVRDTGGAGAIAAAFFGVEYLVVVDQIRLHADAAMAQEDATIEIDSAHAVAYDVVLHTFSTGGITDYVWIPATPCVVDGTDELDVNCANSNNATWGLEVVYRIST